MSPVVAVAGLVGAAAGVRAARRRPSEQRVRGLGDATRQPAPVARRDLPLTSAVTRALASSGWPLPAPEALRLWAAGAAAAAVVGAGLFGLPGGVAGVAAGVAAGPAVASWGRRRRQARLREAVPRLLEEVARELRAGGTVGTAFGRLALRDDPVGEHARAVAGRTALGLRLGEAVPRWAEAAAGGVAEAVRVAAAGLEVAAGAGARSAAALDALAAGLRDADSVRAEVRAHSAQGRVSAWVLGLLPVGALAFSGLFDATTTRILFVHPIGRACLAGGALLEVAGVCWIRRIVRGPA